MQAAIIAGGLASRMQPLTQTTPKSLLLVAGRPFIDWQLEKLASAGYAEAILCVHHLGEAIEAHVGDGSRHGLRVRYSHEGERLLGTGGALRAALPLLDDDLLVTYGDSYLPFDYASPLLSLRAHPDVDGVMSVFKNEGRWDRSNVRLDGDMVGAYEKGTTDPAFDHIDYGAIAVRRRMLSEIPEGAAVGLDAILSELARARRLRACRVSRRFFEIGSPAGLAALEQHLKESP